MDSLTQSLNQFINVKRIIACIANANNNISFEEQKVMMLNIGETSGLQPDQIEILFEDLKNQPDPESLAREISIPLIKRQLIVDLVALCVMKQDWSENEWMILAKAVNGLGVPLPHQELLSASIRSLHKISEEL